MRSVVLLSGGLDSTVALAQARLDGPVLLALTFDYGQRAAAAEIRAAGRICDRYGLPHRVVQLPFLSEITTSALVNRDSAVPELSADQLADATVTAGTARAVWVPNRNGIMINIAAAFAESLRADRVVAGFNREEAQTFPDNSLDFVRAASQALAFSTLNRVRVVSPTLLLDKKEIVALGRRLGAPLDLVWSCYHGGEAMCGRCESCQRFRRAMEQQDE